MLLSQKIILALLLLSSSVNGRLMATEVKLETEPTTVDDARKVLSDSGYELLPAVQKANILTNLFEVVRSKLQQSNEEKKLIELAVLMVRAENLKRLGYPEEIAFQNAENVESYRKMVAAQKPVGSQSRQDRLNAFELLDGFEEQKARILATDDNEFEEEVRYWRMIQKGFTEEHASTLSSSVLKTYAAITFLAMLKNNTDNVNYAFDWAQKGVNPYEVKMHLEDKQLKSILSANAVLGDNPREIAQIIGLETHRDAAAKRWGELKNVVVKPPGRWTRTVKTLQQQLAAQKAKPVVSIDGLAGKDRMEIPSPLIGFPQAQLPRPSSAEGESSDPQSPRPFSAARRR